MRSSLTPTLQRVQLVDPRMILRLRVVPIPPEEVRQRRRQVFVLHCRCCPRTCWVKVESKDERVFTVKTFHYASLGNSREPL